MGRPCSSSSSSPSPSPARRSRLFFLHDILIVRLVNAFYLATFFQPDEFFQALEPAWRLAFGPQSGAWLTWEWHHQLRSSLHPLLFSGAYLAADRLSSVFPSGNALRSALVMGSPRALQALIAALGDWYAWQLAVSIYGRGSNASFFALFLQLFSPWQWYCSTRTFSNSLETTLTAMALYYWPWQLLGSAPASAKENPKPANVLHSLWRLRASLCLAALAIVLRPTNALVWATIVLLALTRVTLRGLSPLTTASVAVFAREALLCGSAVLGLSLAADRHYFGFWTFPPYNWLDFNISKSLAVFYGRNPWHYYILQGMPLLCTTSLPFAVPALLQPRAKSADQANTLRTLSCIVLVTVGALSLIAHKEVRFIYPLLPALNVLAAPRAASFFSSPSPPPPSSHSSSSTAAAFRRLRLRNKPLLFAALGANILFAGYFSSLHQAAPLTVLSFLRREYERIHPSAIHLAHATHYSAPPPAPNSSAGLRPQEDLFALFLMPCHTTPWRSHLLYPGLSAYALTCEPPLHTHPNTPDRDLYRTEADRFYDDPVPFLRDELFAASGTNVPVPRYIAGFQGIEPWLEGFLATPEGAKLGIRLRRVWAAFNGFFTDDERRAGHMLVWDTGVYDHDTPAKKS